MTTLLPFREGTGDKGFDLRELLELVRHGSAELALSYTSAGKRSADLGLAEFYQNVLIPLLTEIGLLWQRGELSVADEHLISERIRELAVLHADAERVRNPVVAEDDRRWMGLCPPGEKHELALNFHALALRQAGWRTWYLGTQVPLADLLGAIEGVRPQVLAFSVSMSECVEGLGLYARQIRARFGASPALIAGGRGLLRAEPSLVAAFDGVATSIIEGSTLAALLAGARPPSSLP